MKTIQYIFLVLGIGFSTGPIDGAWSNWYVETRGVCSASCGVGIRQRTEARVCNTTSPPDGVEECAGSNTRASTEGCIIQNCPVAINGAWGNWDVAKLTDCSATCGVGRRTRLETRQCNNPPPQHGGVHCEGDGRRVSTESCDTQVNCPVAINGAWGNWDVAKLTDCSATCGVGHRTRLETRPCNNPPPQHGGVHCGGDGRRVSTESCDTQVNCPVDGGWSNWKLDRLGACSVTCAAGSRRRHQIRTCTNPAPQNGGKHCVTENKRSEKEACDTKVKCPASESVISPGAIAAVSVSCVVVFVVAAVVVIRMRKRIFKKNKPSTEGRQPVSNPSYDGIVSTDGATIEHAYESTSPVLRPDNMYHSLTEEHKSPNSTPNDVIQAPTNTPNDVIQAPNSTTNDVTESPNHTTDFRSVQIISDDITSV